jgi:branched-chain amino acid transport system substrate-binding protein
MLVGGVLPFTGDSATSGANLEHALFFAAEAVNRAGGIAGRPMSVTTRDTHSDLTLGLGAASALLKDGATTLIGTESEDLTKVIVPIIQPEQRLLLSPGVMSPLTTQLNDSGFWFKMSPSGLAFGRALAKRILQDDGHPTVSVVWVNDEYGRGFSSVFMSSFRALGGQVDASIPYEPDQSNFSNLVQTFLAKNSAALVLIGYPKSATRIIAEWSPTPRGKWYFSNTLETDLFVQNVPARVLDGAWGVSVRLADDAASFAAAFQTRWFDLPIDNAYVYYDSLALVALATEAASQLRGGGLPSPDQVRDQMRSVTNAPGEVVRWNEIGKGLDLIRLGVDIDYDGASGSLDLNAKGEVTEERVTFWTIAGNHIVHE